MSLEAITGLTRYLEYWKERCLKAEKYIEECPCDPDIYPEQMKAFNEWQEIKNKEAR